ncbi:hypothetical protein HMPREF0400_00876 [Fusobacterium periodonticum 1_1_41FAA]|uniref:Uncharacterized protein n=1 Tax=Fusobacterium periodonticum 1_1_41FAA TaxID=469621 RepID=D6LGM6_9FUSO|nr:hypothetical protein HMPREF0400_00876 [Fusobacterium periodonticum 1_1_41FAA]
MYFVINKNLKGYIYDVEYYLNGDDFIKVMIEDLLQVEMKFIAKEWLKNEI